MTPTGSTSIDRRRREKRIGAGPVVQAGVASPTEHSRRRPPTAHVPIFADPWRQSETSGANPLNFAYRWQQWELEHPCPAELRRTWPAFSPTGDGTPFTGSKAAAYLRVVLALVMTPVEAAKRSWHACRVTTATQLFKRRTGTSGGGGSIPRDEIEDVIQAVVRWKTPEAMRIYARMEAETYADYVDLATKTDAGASIPDDLPEVDPERLMREHEATFDAMEAD
jgi:hypothetical protein